jgi:hypothetical protein
MVLLLAPDGTPGQVPFDQLHDALSNGAKVARKVQAPNNPDGTPGDVGYVPVEQFNDVIKAGAKPIPFDEGPKETTMLQRGWKGLTTPLPRTPGSDEEAVREGSGPALTGLSTVGMAGVPIEAIAARSLAPFAPVVKGMVGAAAGRWLGSQAGSAVGQGELGGTLGGLAGGMYGAAGGKIPTNAAELEGVLQSPEAKQEAAEVAATKDQLAKEALQRRVAASNARANAVQPLAPVQGPPSPTPEQLAQGQGVKLTDLAGERPSGVTVVPTPRPLFQGENPNYMPSVPRGTLQDLALAGKPGAAKQIQQLGGQILFAPPGEGISNVRSSVKLSDIAGPGMKLGEGEDLGPGLGTEHTINVGGNRVGSVTVEPKGEGTLHVHWLGGDLAENGVTRSQVVNSLKQEYPGTERFTYDRRRLAKGAEAATTEPREMTLARGSL